jgi:4-hydroxythreonine-4-phosphate dehydrogenase
VKPRPLALSAGDPAGVGAEIIAKAWRALRHDGPSFVVVGDAQLLASAGGGVKVRTVTGPDEALGVFAEALPVIDIPLLSPVISGQPSPTYAPQVIRWIETGVGLALSGAVSGLVTAPIAKAPLYEAGFKFPGHTEFLAELTLAETFEGARGPVMMLAASDLRATLVTIHTSLAKVPGALTIESIVNSGLVTAQALRKDFGIANPRLAVAALNPHAGEGGALGREEIEIIDPAVRALKDLGVDAFGPAPADSLFHPEARVRYDGVLCMYHDQALIPV